MNLLTDDEPRVTSESIVSRRPGIKDLEASLLDSIRNILNSRWCKCDVSDHEIRQRKYTLMNYGIPDFVAVEYDFIQDRQKFLNYVKNTIEQYEPRLSDIRIENQPVTAESGTRSLHFVLRAKLSVEPYSHFSFNTHWDATTGRFLLNEV